MDNALANKTLLELDKNLSDLQRKHEQEYSQFRGKPEERIAAFEKQARGLMDNTIKGLPSERVKQMVAQNGERAFYQKREYEARSADVNRVNLAYSDTMDSLNSLAGESANLWANPSTSYEEKQARLQELLSKGVGTLSNSQMIFDAEKMAELRQKMPEMLIRGAIAGGLDKNPEQILKAAEAGDFDVILPPDEIKKVMDNARVAIPKIREKQQLDDLANLTGVEMDAFASWKAGDPMFLAKLEGLPETSNIKALKKLAVAGKPDPVTSANTLINLGAKYAELMDKEGKAVKGSSRLEDIRGFMLEVIDARTRGEITDGQADSFVKKMALPAYDRIRKGTGGTAFWGIGSSPYNLGYKALKAWSKTNGLNVDQQASVYAAFLDILGETDAPTEEQMRDAAKQAQALYLQREIPALGLLARIPERVLRTNGSGVRGVELTDKERKETEPVSRISQGRIRRNIEHEGIIYEEILENGIPVERKVIGRAKTNGS